MGAKARPQQARGRGGRAYFREYGLDLERSKGRRVLSGIVYVKVVERSTKERITGGGEGRWDGGGGIHRAGQRTPSPPSCSWHLYMLLACRHARPSYPPLFVPLAPLLFSFSFSLLLPDLYCMKVGRRERTGSGNPCARLFFFHSSCFACEDKVDGVLCSGRTRHACDESTSKAKVDRQWDLRIVSFVCLISHVSLDELHPLLIARPRQGSYAHSKKKICNI